MLQNQSHTICGNFGDIFQTSNQYFVVEFVIFAHEYHMSCGLLTSFWEEFNFFIEIRLFLHHNELAVENVTKLKTIYESASSVTLKNPRNSFERASLSRKWEAIWSSESTEILLRS